MERRTLHSEIKNNHPRLSLRTRRGEPARPPQDVSKDIRSIQSMATTDAFLFQHLLPCFGQSYESLTIYTTRFPFFSTIRAS